MQFLFSFYSANNKPILSCCFFSPLALHFSLNNTLVEDSPFPPVFLLHSFFPFLLPPCFMYMNRWCTSVKEFPKVQWEVFLIALYVQLLWLYALTWVCYLYLWCSKDRCECILSVKQQGCICNMTQRKKWVDVYIKSIWLNLLHLWQDAGGFMVWKISFF